MPVNNEVLDSQLLAVLPGAQAEELARGMLRANRRLQFDKLLTGGYTEALVLVVYADGGGEPARKIVLKVGPASGSTPETEQHEAALSASGSEFAAAHLVQQPIDPIDLGDGWTAMFQEIAGGSLSEYRSLTALEGTTGLATAVGAVCKLVLLGWNPATAISNMPLKEFLSAHVRRKLDDDGSLTRWVRERYGDAALTARTLRFPDDDANEGLANPLLFVRDPGSFPGASLQVPAIVGNAHGDLHPGNILLPMGSGTIGSNQFRLIDLSAFHATSPLSRDPLNLLLSIVSRELRQMGRPDRRRLIGLLTGSGDAPVPSTLGELEQLAREVLSAGVDTFKARGLADEWAQQQALSMVGGALVWASRDSLEEDERVWFLELAARTAQSLIGPTGSSLQDDGTHDLGMPLDAKLRVARDAADRVVTACERFDGAVTTMAVLPAGALTSLQAAKLAPAGWDVVLEFDPYTDSGGAYTALEESDVRGRLVQPGQNAAFARGSTTWIAAAGLSSEPKDASQAAMNEPDPRRWRQRTYPGIVDLSRKIAQAYATPAVVVVFGEAGDLERWVVEALSDAFSDRLCVVTIGDNVDSTLQAQVPEHIEADAGLTATLMPMRRTGRKPLAAPTLPSGVNGDDRAALDPGQVEWFASAGELLHSHMGVESDSDIPGARFYRGGTVGWFELGLNVDLPRDGGLERLRRSLRKELAERGTRRVTFTHSAGAGGTTVARRAAWELRDQFPVLLVRAASETGPLSDRVRKLAEITQRSVLLVLEATSGEAVNRLYDELRTDSVSVTLLIVARRSMAAGTGRAPDLGPLDADERESFARLFGAMVPTRTADLHRLGAATDEVSVPFFYALTAFQEDFEGLSEYVRRSLEHVSEETRDILVVIALAHRYGGQPVPSDLFAVKLGLPANRPLRLADRLAKDADGLLIQEPANSWRTVHPLIAEEILRQLLNPLVSTTLQGEDQWRIGLTGWCTKIISWIYDVYDMILPASIRQLLESLFLLRDNQDGLGSTRSGFSELLVAIPTLEGRLEVLRVLAETFPNESHFWGHYGRLLSYEAKDHPMAHEAVGRALELDDNDSALFHISGMAFRTELRDLTASTRPRRGPLKPEVLAKVRELAAAGLQQFARAAELNDVSEYPHVATAQLCVDLIEWGYRHSGQNTYAAFLRQPGSAFYADLLDTAEYALESAREIAATDRLSQKAQEAELSLREFYDDYAGLLEGWRNLLSQDNVLKAPIRRRLVRTYRKRAGSWRSAGPADIKRAVALLDENLQDDPRDSQSLREWLNIARFSGAGLDRAADLVSYWVEAEGTREALFYDYIISALFAIEGRGSAIERYRRTVERSRERVVSFPRRRAVHEWLGTGDGLGSLVSNRDLADWQRSREDEPDPPLLRRVEGRVAQIRRPQSGRIEFGPGLSAFFTPSFANLVADQHENKRVSALIGFAYEGPQAWSVRLI
ncbi:hypothetical protein [Streptomyces canus]|uniref:hypothetical protein n=1 Tax=Streptomyces canus TaxID=58343 RepID=UPI002DD7EA18|nr:hypothetical protein [Streptomyces canus]WSD85995.1 hypothetical protein OG925_17580 [Streptomyces canus]